MKKKLIVIHGTMGVGKTTVCKKLLTNLQNSFWLDGDWCWMMNPWIFDEENKKMVIKNITYILKNFLINSHSQYIILSWILHEKSIFDDFLKPLKHFDFNTTIVTLYCSEEELRKRLQKNKTNPEFIEQSVKRIPLYFKINSAKIDTTLLSVDQTVDKIINVINLPT